MPWDLVTGSGGDPKETSILVVHAAALPTGEVLFFGGSEHSFSRFSDYKGGVSFLKAQRFNFTSEQLFNITPSPDTDLFCCGHAFMGDGRLLAAGGTRDWPIDFYGDPPPMHAHAAPVFDQDPDDVNAHEALGHWDGERACWVYNHWQHRWVRVRDLAFEAIASLPQHQQGGGRWYPTLITLENGRVIAFGGHPSHEHRPHENLNPETYSAGKDEWEVHADREINFSYDYYPRGHLLQDGRIFFASPISGEGCGIYDPQDGSFETIENLPQNKLDQGFTEHYFTTVLLPLLPEDNYQARVLATGWAGNAIRLHVGNAGWVEAGNRDWGSPPARRNGCAILLPTGQVALVGGVEPTVVQNEDGEDVLRERDTGGVQRTEVYSPGINWGIGQYTQPQQWQTDNEADAAEIVRNYHSVALLVADGRILTAGSNINASTGHPADVARKEIEFYSPWYVNEDGRPEISDAPSSISYGQSFLVESADAGDIQRAALIRLGSVTHAFDADQRYVGLQILDQTDNNLRLRAPPNGGVAPPGYYTLWIINNSGLPCSRASYVKIGHQGLFIVLNRSTISVHEIESMLAGGLTVIPDAVQVIFSNAQPNDYVGPQIWLTLDTVAGEPAQDFGLSLQITDVSFDIGQEHGDTAQRIVYTYSLRVSSTDVFETFDEFRQLQIRVESDTLSSGAVIRLHKQPNPYILNGEEFWVSTDLRVFKVIEDGQVPIPPFPVVNNFDPHQLLNDTLEQFNDLAGAPGTHPFDGIDPDQEDAKLELSRSVRAGVGAPLKRVHNFAIARVRYRSVSTEAPNVRMFFRLFNTVGTALEYDESGTYNRDGNGPNAAPLIGRDGKVILSIPYFGSPRIDTTTQSMSEQNDPVNVRTLAATGAQESETYFGCVLDFNQDTPRFPLYPENDGPYTDDLKSLQELTRGFHQCLVSEIHFGDDLIPSRATPSGSDKLAQRNIWIEEAPNPGVSAESRTVHATCELKATRAALSATASGTFDELIIHWNNLPKQSRASIYLPSQSAAEIIEASATHHAGPALKQIDEHTVEFIIGDVSFLPIPRGTELTVPGLIRIELPEGITKGQLFRINAHQFSDFGRPRNASREVIGSFQFDIPVKSSEEVAPELRKRFSVLKHVALSVPEQDRWYPIFERLVAEYSDRLTGLGIDPNEIAPSPDGTGEAPQDDPAPDDCLGSDEMGENSTIHCYTGRIFKLRYDCFGDFEGFSLSSCDNEWVFSACKKGLEKLLVTACEDEVKVTVRVKIEGHSNEDCINTICPWSKNPVAKNARTHYLDHSVGFCSVAHRDLFARATQLFEQAVLKSKKTVQISECVNDTCPWSGEPVRQGASTTYRECRVGFCSKEHRDQFQAAIRYFNEIIACNDQENHIKGKVIGVDLQCC